VELAKRILFKSFRWFTFKFCDERMSGYLEIVPIRLSVLLLVIYRESIEFPPGPMDYKR
jgi:hypothetical protein